MHRLRVIVIRDNIFKMQNNHTFENAWLICVVLIQLDKLDFYLMLYKSLSFTTQKGYLKIQSSLQGEKTLELYNKLLNGGIL